MAQTGGVVRFCAEGDCILPSPRSTRDLERRPWHPVLNTESIYMAQRSLTPNLNSGRIQLLRKSLTPEARRAHLGMYNSTGSLIRHPAEIGVKSGRFTAPCTPLRSKPLNPLNSPGNRSPLAQRPTASQSSVVTFTFIEKASVKTMNGAPAMNTENKPSPQLLKKHSLGSRYSSFEKEVNVCHGIADVQQRAIAPLCDTASPVSIRKQLQPGSPIPAQKTSEGGSGIASPCLPNIELFNVSQSQDSCKRTPSRKHSPTEGSQPVDQRPSHDPVMRRETPEIQHKIMDNAIASLLNEAGPPPEDRARILKSPMRTGSPCEADLWDPATESSSRAQRIAKAKWEFFYGSPEPQRAGIAQVQKAADSTTEDSLQKTNSLPRQQKQELEQDVPRHSLCHVEVEIDTTPSADLPPGSCESGIIRRTVKYSETDLDSVPLRCYHETNIDDILAEKEEVDSAIGSQKDSESNKSFTGTIGRRNSELEEPCPAGEHQARATGDSHLQNGQEDEEEDEVFQESRPEISTRADAQAVLKSPVPFVLGLRLSEDGTDSFSKHFETIMESHRAKGTSYTSLDSIDALSSPGMNQSSFFSFDLPTLTPDIQDQIRHNARLIEENFAPLAHLDPDSGTSSTTDPAWNEREEEEQPGVSDGAARGLTRSPCRSEDSFIMMQSVVLNDHPLSQLVSDSESELDSTEQLALGSTDTLSNGHKADQEAAQRLAKRLYNLDGFKKADVARHLGKNNEFSKMVAEEYLKFFVFTGQNLDQALRTFLRELALMGETQERERVLAHFSQRYHQCNPDTITSEDGVHTLTCALMLLNTDLHGHNIGKRMSCCEFIGNLEGLNGGSDFPRELLKSLYSSIKNEKLQWTIDEEELRRSLSELADPNPKSIKRISSCGNPFLDFSQDPNITTYKYGLLVRKVHADPDCKKTPRGKRGWKTFNGILKGMILYLQKEEYKPGKTLSEEDLKNAISIHHSLATRASDYSKRPNVFYLRTADWRVFLFQAQNTEQMHSWITRINVVAAMFSAPPFPAAIGSHKKFSRPLLPSATTRLSQEEQMKTHETKFKSMSSDLVEHRTCPPDKKLKGKESDEFKQREVYLEFEKSRYGTYAMLLRAKLKAGTEDLEAFEKTMFESTEIDEDGLKKSRSSPSLNLDPPATSAKVKRNVSERGSSRPTYSSNNPQKP
ncbi:PH and SEC7 domain-containing protein 1 isoform X2 [Ambystoma mexicanum]|uniref:PH and SEC7 domain-containing protein 1 isoform X2 n=1 Tax=Ambystoma mexicanum TaxID=8296 RepID=UPI0037E7B77B